MAAEASVYDHLARGGTLPEWFVTFQAAKPVRVTVVANEDRSRGPLLPAMPREGSSVVEVVGQRAQKDNDPVTFESAAYAIPVGGRQEVSAAEPRAERVSLPVGQPRWPFSHARAVYLADYAMRKDGLPQDPFYRLQALGDKRAEKLLFVGAVVKDALGETSLQEREEKMRRASEIIHGQRFWVKVRRVINGLSPIAAFPALAMNVPAENMYEASNHIIDPAPYGQELPVGSVLHFVFKSVSKDWTIHNPFPDWLQRFVETSPTGRITEAIFAVLSVFALSRFSRNYQAKRVLDVLEGKLDQDLIPYRPSFQERAQTFAQNVRSEGQKRWESTKEIIANKTAPVREWF